MSAEQWLADYQRELAGAADGAVRANARLRQVGGHAIAPRGEVEAWVGVSGALERLRLTAHARALEPDALAKLIVATAKAAQRSAAGQITEIMTDFVGPGAALDLVKAHLPGGVDTPPPGARRSAKSTVDEDVYFANPEVRE
ncbi:YbaB/EbfC family nucleoid-associated protein [Actinokineospora iranica]|uniref:YbaB/EbfC DNA-binding family protein n=1 Tax=Actinokineospora iranica TaxID=1271860 RepID=A0A1G6UB87_9PSEU|nr:YbaB/EbfC family nucleoid-associated protein [Actinokineospora iranica]SDD38662.1 YbaB/EbfC DNA-binding family protein [Actinokineospora iranica]